MGTYAITGGASGIGAAIAQQLRDDGHNIITVDIQQADIVANLATSEGRTQAADAIRDTAGEDLAGLVACAGVGSHIPDRALITAVNYFGAVQLIEGLRDVLAANGASVLLISSNSAPMQTNPEYVAALLAGDEAVAAGLAADMQSQPVYSGSKQAFTIWMRRNTAEYAGLGIRMNAIGPGYTRTPLSAAAEDDPTYGEAIKQFYATSKVCSLLSVDLGREFATVIRSQSPPSRPEAPRTRNVRCGRPLRGRLDPSHNHRGGTPLPQIARLYL